MRACSSCLHAMSRQKLPPPTDCPERWLLKQPRTRKPYILRTASTVRRRLHMHTHACAYIRLCCQ